MDRIYRHQRHVYDLTRRYYLFGRDRLLRELQPPPGGRVLEIGCGTARNLLAARALYPTARLFGIDISLEMLDTAQQALRRRGADGIRLARADATCFDPAVLFGQPSFSRIFMSYSLSMIPAWEMAVDEAVRWLSPGGELHIVDFGRHARMPAIGRGSLRAWLRLFHVQPRDELESVLRRRDDADVVAFETLPLDYACRAVLRRRAAPLRRV
jgi:S-adenosylmethionine-diacylgycerolhomoserine-N-methlytransferase